ncbi:hypothetical protein OROHE_022336 [Orobanche hederae]
MHTHNFLEVGAVALLVGDMEAKMKGETWRIFGSAAMPFLDQLLQPSLLTTLTNSNSAFAHLRAITALKHSKQGTHQICHAMTFSEKSFKTVDGGDSGVVTQATAESGVESRIIEEGFFVAAAYDECSVCCFGGVVCRL